MEWLATFLERSASLTNRASPTSEHHLFIPSSIIFDNDNGPDLPGLQTLNLQDVNAPFFDEQGFVYL